MTRRVFAIGSAFGAAGVALYKPKDLRAETPAERAKKIVDNTIDALGGDAFRNLQTRTESGRAYSFYREQLSGLALAHLYTKYLPVAKTEDIRQVQRQVFGKKADDAVIFTGQDAYEVTFRGAKPMAEQRVKQSRESTLHDFFYILRERLEEPGISFDAAGSDVVENQPVEKIDVYDFANRRVTVWIHSSTHLPVKQRFFRVDPIINDRREEVTRYSKYRDVGDGVMWPYDLQRERDTEKIFELYSDHVKINEPLNEKLFELPNGIKMLNRDKGISN